MKLFFAIFAFLLVSFTTEAQTYIQGNSLHTNSVIPVGGNTIDFNGAQLIGLSVGPTVANKVFISENGTDATCVIGNQFLPCLTMAKAMSLASAAPSVVNAIQAVDCGTYAASGLDWFPNVIFIGLSQSTGFSSPSCTTLDLGNAGITMDASWGNAGPYIGGIQQASITSSGSVAALTFDFSAISTGNNFFNFTDVQLPGNLDLNLLSNNTGNQVTFNAFNVIQNNRSINITDGFLFVTNYLNENSGANVTSTGANNTALFSTNAVYGNVNINGNASGGYAYFDLLSGAIDGSIVTATSNSFLQAQEGTLPAASSISGTGVVFYNGDAVQLPYFPGNAGNWGIIGGTPNSVQLALDQIAAFLQAIPSGSISYSPTNPSQWYFQLGSLPSTAQQALDFIAQSGVLNVNSANIIYVNNQGNDTTCLQGLVTSPCASLAGAETYLVNNGTQNGAVIFIDGTGEYSFVGVDITANLTVISYNSQLTSIDFGNGPTFDPVTWATGGALNLINVGLRSSTAPPTVTFDVGTASMGASGALFMDGVFSEMYVANVDFTGTTNPGNVNFTVQNSFSADPWEFDDSNFSMSNTEVDAPFLINYTTAMNTNPLITTSAFPVGSFTFQTTGTGSLFPVMTASHVEALGSGFTLNGANVAMTVSLGVLPVSSAVNILGGADLGVDGDGVYIPYTPTSRPNWTGLTGTAPSNLAQGEDLLAGALGGGTGNLAVNNVSVANYFTIPIAPLGGPGLVGAPGGSLEMTSTGVLCSYIGGNWVSSASGSPTPCPF
jgi:hypothetical protein